MVKTIDGMNTSSLMRVVSGILFSVLLMALLQNVMFLAGVSCHWVIFWVSVVASPLISSRFVWGKTCAIGFCVLVLFALLAVLLPSYCDGDAASAYFPCERAIIEGWNPVFGFDLEGFEKYTSGYSVAKWHAVFTPHVMSVVGAVVARGLNIFSGVTFVNLALILSLCICLWRFAIGEWNSRIGAIILVISSVFSLRFRAMLGGSIGYAFFATTVLAFVSLANWRRGNDIEDLFISAVSVVLCASIKPGGLPVLIVFLALMSLFAKSSKRVVCVLAAVILFVLILNVSPYITSSIHFSSPFYPAHSFDKSVRLYDMTSDFIGDENWHRMGYLARIIYAWFPTEIALRFTGWWYDIPNFQVSFNGGVDLGKWESGTGYIFRWLFLAGSVALMLSRRNLVWLVIAVFFALSCLLPLKYIGYMPYAPYMEIVPVLALLNFVYRHRSLPIHRKLFVLAAGLCISVLCCYSFVMAARGVASLGRSVAFERLRTQAIDVLAKRNKAVAINRADFRSFSMKERLLAGGVDINPDSPVQIQYDTRWLVPYVGSIDAEAIGRFDRKYCTIKGVKDLVSFPWVEAFFGMEVRKSEDHDD